MKNNTSLAALVAALRREGALVSKPVTDAFRAIDRALFVPTESRIFAYEDRPLPIGFGQTISQPTTVAFMLEQLGTKPSDRILDVGSGSGWTTALLASLVGPKGRVIGTEIIPELIRFGQENLARFDFPRARILTARKDIVGFPDEAPYDRILVSAAAETLPRSLVAQLKTGGTLVIPVRNSVWRLTKENENNLSAVEYPGFRFVPLITCNKRK